MSGIRLPLVNGLCMNPDCPRCGPVLSRRRCGPPWFRERCLVCGGAGRPLSALPDWKHVPLVGGGTADPFEVTLGARTEVKQWPWPGHRLSCPVQQILDSAYQSRYRAYAAAHRRTPEMMLAHDREAWPGGKMAGFIIWIGEKWRAWEAATGYRRVRGWTSYGPDSKALRWTMPA